jgi:hypothetical protein
MTQSDPDRISAADKAIEDAVDLMRAALIDLHIDQKVEAVERLRGWIAPEEASWLPEVERRNRDKMH